MGDRVGTEGTSHDEGKGVFVWQMSRLHFVPLDMTAEWIWVTESGWRGSSRDGGKAVFVWEILAG